METVTAGYIVTGTAVTYFHYIYSVDVNNTNAHTKSNTFYYYNYCNIYYNKLPTQPGGITSLTVPYLYC